MGILFVETVAMFELTGKYGTAKIFSDGQDEKAVGQIIGLLNQPFVNGCQVRIMSDYHYGAGCVIGFTCNLGDKIIPNLVGVDLGCGMFVVDLGKINLDLVYLDDTIHSKIPAGKTAHKNIIQKFSKITNLKCYRELKHTEIFERQIGTLGGGNHFLEIDIGDNDNKYLVIHSGSRNLGKQVADYYQNLAIESCKGLGDFNQVKMDLIGFLKVTGKKTEIQKEIKRLEKEFSNAQPKYPRDLCFLQNEQREDYLHDMAICQEYASLNRMTMVKIIFDAMQIDNGDSFETVHNYASDGMIRKGAVSAKIGEKLIIPINMRDGSLICIGKGNNDWNDSAPHGAGRLMGRNEAKRTLSLTEFESTMSGVYSTTVNGSTLDESPEAYKSMDEIIANIGDTVTVEKIIRPIYNFKASE
jgi:RNA-splicing ligase RtcB